MNDETRLVQIGKNRFTTHYYTATGECPVVIYNDPHSTVWVMDVTVVCIGEVYTKRFRGIMALLRHLEEMDKKWKP